MLKRLSLRIKIMFAICALVAIAMLGGSTTIWMVHRMNSAVSSVISSKVAALNVSQELESSLAMQRGLLSYYYIDGKSEWLTQLDQYRFEFENWLKKARELADSGRERELLNDIESKYIRYSNLRERVIELYKAGKREEGYALHKEVRSPFYSVRDLCEQFKQVQYERVSSISEGIRLKVAFFDTAASMAMVCALGLGITLGVLLLSRVLVPIRLLALTAGRDGGVSLDEPDEVKALGKKIQGLIESVDSTRIELDQSREHLLQSEKLAQIGKLAAGVAHSIRNPLTSVKMRLFTLERTLLLSTAQKEDFEVISEEIRHIDTIVGNFLEFSRPPKLKIQKASPSEVVDMAVQLLRHRIDSYGVTLEVMRERKLPDVDCDPEQLKEVLVNLIVNACEAMGDGGRILITEEEGTNDPMGRVVVIRVSDSGPGIPEAIREKIFEPFYTTKQEGTGLGLSIANRIIHEHKGCLSVKCRPRKGAVFTITLPCQEEGAWLRSL
ncbi:Integral membrane sensor signal transduction histidine kinase [Syntrophobacter sp. SbD2]|nr:Integral membrane sensor signal transduction histidine kinase [Syntrophobacter sp. SbD2]